MDFDEGNEYHAVDVCISAISHGAILINDLNGGEMWVPKSVAQGGPDFSKKDITGEVISIGIKKWFCVKNGILEDS